MISAKPIFKNMIAFINTDMDAVHKAYVNKKRYKKLDVNVYTPFPIDAILNAKSISFKKLTYEEYLAKKRKNKI
jgi:hypothetical protein